jgi:hypothetical protein
MEPLSIITAKLVFAMGSILQAATGLGAGLVVVPLLALIILDLVLATAPAFWCPVS